MAATSNVTTFIVKLENGMTQLRDIVNNNASPMDVIMIVHIQIHPNLQKTYNLQRMVIFNSLFIINICSIN
jgi:hypothetical protein